ncbi:MAG: tRNA (adenosine(37)-N6)-threonylcarbamoyltransferase complex transferase subunit TsaD, partial [Chloroflexi bacterium]|nr:tRNA (adenosine(37)-N6)-threonylcarbamoyltransferase complex transferase subunit TsaD [Chloroflexota bacterium]
MNVLGIESSCDETAAAVVANGRLILSNVVASQIALHAAYGGVVPEVASRQHLRDFLPVLQEALASSGGPVAVDAIAATYGPGLAGSLLVGLNLAKALALAWDLPLVGVNHLEGHIYANWLAPPGAEDAGPEPRFPLLCLVVSGGHTELVLMEDHGSYRRLGATRDDAAGEAFDKVARILGLGFPGGPAIQAAAAGGDPRHYLVPRAWLRGTHDFSFSGVKTAMLHLVQSPERESADLPDLAASFQEAVADVLAEKTVAAARRWGVNEVLLSGGVAAN